MKKKKMLALQLAILLAMSLFLQGCQKDNVTQETVETVQGETTVEPNNTETSGERTDNAGETVAESEPAETTDSQPEETDIAENDTAETGTVETDEPQETTTPEPEDNTPALATPATCGALQVEGTQLVDSDGNPVQLKGISTHGLAWFPGYVNKDCFKQLREEWNANVIRLAMYTAESGGYCSGGDKNALKQLIHDGVAYATELDMYVIIDWHILSDNNPNTYKEDAKAFFTEMAETYADYNNVIYEICNEPNGGTSWSEIKSYAEEVIPVIRQYDEDAIIIVGTPNWSQYVDQAAANPITGYDNIMYALHFYAATHTDSLRNTMTAAIDAGLPVFVTEYGICDASGNGAIDVYQANEWVKTMNSYNVSYVAWNLSNKNESSAMISSGCNKTSGFSESDLSTCGKWVYELLTGKNAAELQGTPAQGNNGSQSANNQGTNSSGNNQNNASNQGNSGSGSNSTAGTATTLTNGDITVTAEVANSWESEGKTFYQYNLTLQNTSGTDCTNWNITLNFSGNISFSDGWSGNYTASGNVLQISNVDYNGNISAGSSIRDIGFIISGPSGLTVSQ
ncbi:MAG: cellulase family glycosylhydrolase [Lachnospiraceae bacterium]|nr:cellulase family glycosylhydrolase [Lachnospiraceae bacterium]